MYCDIEPLAILSFDVESLAVQSCRKHSTVRIADMAGGVACCVVVAEVVAEVAVEVAVEVVAVVAAEVVAEVAVEVVAEVLVELAAGGLEYHLQIWLVVPVV